MLGLAILFFFGVYLLITLWVVSTTAAWARRNNRSPLKWGGLAAFVMYNLVFWDWLPTVVAHQYYCATEAGFWVYKTPEQWKDENPRVAETLHPLLPAKQINLPIGRISQLNDRFGSFSLVEPISNLPIRRSTSLIIDIKTQQIIFKDVDFLRGNGALALGFEDSWKFWLQRDTCYTLQKRRELYSDMTVFYNEFHLR